VPTYAYACTSCDNRFEVHQSFSDDSLTRCERCEGTLRKLFNSVGIVFKGSGFYRTDSRAAASATAPNGSGKESSKKDSGKDAPSKSSSEGSSGKESGSSSAAKESTPSTSRSTAAAAAKT